MSGLPEFSAAAGASPGLGTKPGDSMLLSHCRPVNGYSHSHAPSSHGKPFMHGKGQPAADDSKRESDYFDQKNAQAHDVIEWHFEFVLSVDQRRQKQHEI